MFLRKKADIVGRSENDKTAALQSDLCSRIAARLTKEMTVLEISCGTGRMTLPLCGNAALWEATDASAIKIARARRLPHSDRLRFTVMDPASLSFEHSTFDAVIAVNALQTAEKPDVVLREIRRVLRPGGLLIAPTVVYGARKKLILQHSRRCWRAVEFIDIIKSYDFSIEKAVLVPNEVAPLCYLEAISHK